MRFRLALCGLVIGCGSAWANTKASTETVEQALCRVIEEAALARQIPRDFLTRLIWQESSFRPGVISPAGAQGVAQFMPGTAQERGLADPFDPEQAVPKAAEFLSDLATRFGNLGLAAAAYNGGPARVASWLAGQGELPNETRHYVLAVTGRTAEDWASDLKDRANTRTADAAGPGAQTCLQVVAALRKFAPEHPGETPFAPWGVQLAGNFSKERALATFERASRAYSSILADAQPMIIGTRLRYRGTGTFYRVRAPAATRKEAEQLCNRIRTAGGSCVVLSS
jgi:Transglycosylase SLT domain/SPOR domain